MCRNKRIISMVPKRPGHRVEYDIEPLFIKSLHTGTTTDTVINHHLIQSIFLYIVTL